MARRFKNIFSFQCVMGALCLLMLAACVPSEPEGVDTEGLTRIGDQLHARGDDASAADFYSRAIQHAPKDIQARKSLAAILEARGNNEAAATQYADAIAIEPDNGELRRNYGRILLKLNRPEDAKAQYQKALQIDPDDIKVMNGLGVSLDYLHDHAAAQAVYRQALEDHPDDIVTLANLGHSYDLSGAWEEAIPLLEPHLNDKEATPAFRQNLAEAYGMAGMDADAERVLRIDLSPEQIKHSLAYYRSQRKHRGAADFLTADLGSFPTKDIAQSQAEALQDQFAEQLEGLTVAVTPQVKSIGGTPVFSVSVKGFENTGRLHAFCDRLRKENFSCAAKTGG